MSRRKPKGWVKEPVRHGLASKGVKTAAPGRKQPVPSGFEIDERAEDYAESTADDIEEVLNDRGFDPGGFEGEEALGDAIQEEAGDRVFEPLLQVVAQREDLDPDADEEQITDIAASAFQKGVHVVAAAMWADMERARVQARPHVLWEHQQLAARIYRSPEKISGMSNEELVGALRAIDHLQSQANLHYDTEKKGALKVRVSDEIRRRIRRGRGTFKETTITVYRDAGVSGRQQIVGTRVKTRDSGGYVVVMTHDGKFSTRKAHTKELPRGATIVANAPTKPLALKAARGYRERRKRALGL